MRASSALADTHLVVRILIAIVLAGVCCMCVQHFVTHFFSSLTGKLGVELIVALCLELSELIGAFEGNYGVESVCRLASGAAACLAATALLSEEVQLVLDISVEGPEHVARSAGATHLAAQLLGFGLDVVLVLL
jgi:hypothetical protein